MNKVNPSGKDELCWIEEYTSQNSSGPDIVNTTVRQQRCAEVGETGGNVDKPGLDIVVGGPHTKKSTPAAPSPAPINNLDDCMNGAGGGVSGTIFAILVGGSAGLNGNLTVPYSSLAHWNLNGLQATGSGYVTPLAGLGAFAGFGPGGSLGNSYGAAKDGWGSSATPVVQAGAGDGGVQLSRSYTATLVGCH